MPWMECFIKDVSLAKLSKSESAWAAHFFFLATLIEIHRRVFREPHMALHREVAWRTWTVRVVIQPEGG